MTVTMTETTTMTKKMKKKKTKKKDLLLLYYGLEDVDMGMLFEHSPHQENPPAL